MTSQEQWRVVSIKDVCEAIVDCVNKTAPTIENETPYKMIRTSNVKGGWIDLDDVKFVEADVFAKWNRRATPRRGDVILTREAPLGEVGMIRTRDQVFLGQRLVLYRADPKKLDNCFLLAAFQSDYVQGQIKSLGSGATVEHMRVPDAEKLTIKLPPLTTQHRIGEILSTYDDLIENSTRRIKILEQMAQMLYREWFVSFRFPDSHKLRMTNSELGPIPEGWKVTTLGEIAEVNQTTIKLKQPDDLITYVDIASVSTGRIEQKVRIPFGDAPGRARRLVRKGDIIWSTVRPNRKSFALILNPEPDLVVSTGFAVLTPAKVPFTYLYFCSTTDEFARYLSNHATGAAYPAVNAADFEKARVLLPPESLLQRFHSLTASCLELRDCLQRRRNNLSTTRNLLLPKLVSGEICVGHLETAAAAQIS